MKRSLRRTRGTEAATPHGTAAEVFPEASAVLLEGRLRSADEPKREFRRRVLERHGVDTTLLPTVDRIDAAVGALTGLLAMEGQRTTVGDPDEGVILLPVAVLPTVALQRAGGGIAPRSGVGVSQGVTDVTVGECLCGCGAPVRRRFLPGHDAKLSPGCCVCTVPGTRTRPLS